jgi:hypothetical protein
MYHGLERGQRWGELHVFDPEGDVLLMLERYLKEDDLVEKCESVPEGGFVSRGMGSTRGTSIIGRCPRLA